MSMVVGPIEYIIVGFPGNKFNEPGVRARACQADRKWAGPASSTSS